MSEPLKADDVRRLWERLTTDGGDPNYLIVHPKVVAKLALIERRRQHWYWRLWWRIWYAPSDLRDWVRRRSEEE